MTEQRSSRGWLRFVLGLIGGLGLGAAVAALLKLDSDEESAGGRAKQLPAGTSTPAAAPGGAGQVPSIVTDSSRVITPLNGATDGSERALAAPPGSLRARWQEAVAAYHEASERKGVEMRERLRDLTQRR